MNTKRLQEQPVRLARMLFMLYCAIPMLFSLLTVFPLYFIVFRFTDRSKAPHRAHALSRNWAFFLFRAFFIRYRLNTRYAPRKEGVYVLVANHRSFIDIPAYALSSCNTVRFLSKEELTWIPVIGYVIRRLYITVNRADHRDRQRSLEKMLRSLKDGISVFLAPEGTRNTGSAPLLPFKDGAFRLAIAAQCPIGILVLHNAQTILSTLRPLEMRPGTLYGEWLPEIDTRGMTEKDIALLKIKVYSAMEEALLRGPQAVGKRPH